VAKRTAFLQTPRQLSLLAVACAIGFAALLGVAYGSEPAAHADALALQGFGEQLRGPRLARLAEDVARLVDPGPFALLVVSVVVLGLAVGGVREAAAAAVLLGGANITTQALKPVLASPRGTLGGWVLGPEAFPSGHATAAMSLALAAVVVSPRWARPVVAVGGAGLSIGVGFSLIAIDAHFPSDVAGGYLVAGGWCFAVQAVLLALERRRPRPSHEPPARSGHVLALVAMLVLLAAAAVYGASRTSSLLDYAEGHTVFALVAAVTAALSVLIVGAAAVASEAGR
jgi:membrane-associated phospholipid phosphatase